MVSVLMVLQTLNEASWLCICSIHVYAQVSGTFVTFLGLLFAVAELHGYISLLQPRTC